MGIWDELQSFVSRLISRKVPSKRPSEDNVTATFGGQPATAFVSNFTKVADAVKLNGAQILDEYFPDPHLREKIGRILTNLGKFFVDSAVNESLKGLTGGVHVYKIVKEGLKDERNSVPRNSGIKKQDLMIAVEEMQAKMEEMQTKMEKMQEELNILKQQNQISTKYSRELEPLKECCDEPIKSSASSPSDCEKAFIRSRL